MSSQLNDGSLAPHIEAPSEAMLTVSNPRVSAAASTATLSAGKDAERFSATRSPESRTRWASTGATRLRTSAGST